MVADRPDSRSDAQRHRQFKLISLPLLLPLLLLLGSCEFLTRTPVLPYMTYVVKELSVEGRIPNPMLYADVIPVATSDQTFVALIGRAELRADFDRLLLVDDAFGLRVERSDEFPARLNRSGLITSEDRILLGNLLYDPVTNTITNTAAPEDDSFAGIQVGGNYYTFDYGDENAVYLEEYDSSFISTGGGGQVQLSADTIPEGFVHGQQYVDGAGNRSVVLFVSLSSEGGPIYVVDIPNSAVPGLSGPLFSASDPEGSAFDTVVLSANRVEQVTKTREGIIVLDEEGGELRRYDNETGALLDTFRPKGGDEGHWEELLFAFFIRGENYLILDRERELLYEVAPWW
ncbi:MAG: hypothetical protein ACOC47_01960 [Alkalispirochaetaceae bacterium]